MASSSLREVAKTSRGLPVSSLTLGQCSPPCLSYLNPVGFPVAPAGPQTHSDLRAFVPAASSTWASIPSKVPSNVLMPLSLPVFWRLFSDVILWLCYPTSLQLSSSTTTFYPSFPSCSFLQHFSTSHVYCLSPPTRSKCNEDNHVLHCLRGGPGAKERAW